MALRKMKWAVDMHQFYALSEPVLFLFSKNSNTYVVTFVSIRVYPTAGQHVKYIRWSRSTFCHFRVVVADLKNWWKTFEILVLLVSAAYCNISELVLTLDTGHSSAKPGKHFDPKKATKSFKVRTSEKFMHPKVQSGHYNLGRIWFISSYSEELLV